MGSSSAYAHHFALSLVATQLFFAGFLCQTTVAQTKKPKGTLTNARATSLLMYTTIPLESEIFEGNDYRHVQTVRSYALPNNGIAVSCFGQDHRTRIYFFTDADLKAMAGNKRTAIKPKFVLDSVIVHSFVVHDSTITYLSTPISGLARISLDSLKNKSVDEWFNDWYGTESTVFVSSKGGPAWQQERESVFVRSEYTIVDEDGNPLKSVTVFDETYKGESLEITHRRTRSYNSVQFTNGDVGLVRMTKNPKYLDLLRFVVK